MRKFNTEGVQACVDKGYITQEEAIYGPMELI